MPRSIALAALLLAVTAGAACDTRVGADPAQRFLLDRLDQDMAEVRRDNAARVNPSFPCHAILQTIPSFKNAGPDTRARLAEAKKLCHDGALAFADAQVARLEAARRAREDLVEECFDLEHALDILVTLDERDPAAVALAGKRKTLCP